MASNEPIVSIAGTGWVTRSGRTFALTSLPVGNNYPSAQDKDNQIDNAQQRQDFLLANEVD